MAPPLPARVQRISERNARTSGVTRYPGTEQEGKGNPKSRSNELGSCQIVAPQELLRRQGFQ